MGLPRLPAPRQQRTWRTEMYQQKLSVVFLVTDHLTGFCRGTSARTPCSGSCCCWCRGPAARARAAPPARPPRRPRGRGWRPRRGRGRGRGRGSGAGAGWRGGRGTWGQPPARPRGRRGRTAGSEVIIVEDDENIIVSHKLNAPAYFSVLLHCHNIVMSRAREFSWPQEQHSGLLNTTSST